MVTPTKINTPGWNLNRYVVSAGCLFTLVVCPTSIGGEIDSFTGPDGRRIFSNTRNISIAPTSSPTLPEPGASTRTRRREQPPAGIGRLIDRIARMHGMDPELVKAVARVESNYNPTAISPKGALGVMQLLPETTKRFGGVADTYDPAQNAEIFSVTGPDGRRIFSNSGDIAISPAKLSPAPEPGVRLRIRRKGRPPAGIGRLIDRIARKHGMDPELVKAVARVESNYNPTAISPKGALGVMQLLPETAKRFGVADAYDPAQNIEGGIRYLKFLRDQFPGNLSLVLAAYNAGENAVRKHGGIPPYQETRDYVHKIRQLYGQDLPDTTAGGIKPDIVSYRDSAGRLVYSNLETSYR